MRLSEKMKSQSISRSHASTPDISADAVNGIWPFDSTGVGLTEVSDKDIDIALFDGITENISVITAAATIVSSK